MLKQHGFENVLHLSRKLAGKFLNKAAFYYVQAKPENYNIYKYRFSNVGLGTLQRTIKFKL